MDPRTPPAIGRYEVLDSIGEGGMGVVYRARDPRIARIVAIKLLRLGSSDLRDRFEREARSAGNLTHANIVTIFDFGEHHGQPFIVMEYVEGETLADQIRERVSLSLAAKLDFIEMLARGLAYAHRQGVIHRDVKPANLMIDRHGVLKILDFGIARVQDSGTTLGGMLIGTPNYMSPEQADGRTVDPRSDIFSVGTVFYELLSYRQAFPGQSIHGILDRVLHRQPEPLDAVCPGLDPAVQLIVAKALEKDPEDRYQTLDQLQRDLARCRVHLASDAELSAHETLASFIPQTPPPRTPRSGATREDLSRRRADQIEAHLKQAAEAFDAADFEGTIAACEQAAFIDPDEPRALALLDRAREALDRRQAAEMLEQADVLVQHGDVMAAEAMIARALQLDPLSTRAARLLQDAEAARERERAAQEQRQRADAIVQTARQNASELAWDAALRAAGDALALDPHNVEAREIARQAGAAIEARRAGEERERLARAEREQREREAAIAQQVRLRERSDALTRARAAVDAGQHEAALVLIDRLIEQAPADEEALQLRSVASAALGRIRAEARDAARREEAAARERVRRQMADQPATGTSEGSVVPPRAAPSPAPTAPLPRVAAKSGAVPQSRVKSLVALGAAVALLVVAIVWPIARPKPQTGTTTAVASGSLILDALPWAEVVSIVDDKGTAQPLPANAYTPLSLSLAVGEYDVTLRHGSTKTLRLRVTPSGVTHPPAADFGPIEAAEYFRRLGW